MSAACAGRFVTLPVPEAAARGRGLPAGDAILGATTWRQWLRAPDGPGAAATRHDAMRPACVAPPL